jgi:uncharacterized metal-binding protein
MAREHEQLSLVYACSGCSSAAQLANHLAVRLDREGSAEMSCIAGVGGHVPKLVRTAQEAVQHGRPIVAIDGCALSCVKASLARHDLSPTVHIQLAHRGVKKVYRTDFDENQASTLLSELRAQVQTLNTQYATRTSHSPAGLASPSETDPH